MISRILEFFRESAAARERDSDRNGFLSYAGEYHAVGVGFLAAVIGVFTGNWELLAVLAAVITGGREVKNNHLRDAAKEVAYTALGVALGLGVTVLFHVL